ncbi:metalloreductase STEAP2 [Elysia marginata]|uniref:Metalloreductase STEAP2 n=1 Tax=Elysia marginata TaxID=1093978 RepID=A0AAV4JJ57_9GAST|nr:metalloreductase STEAP2 [Elysia marginata]
MSALGDSFCGVELVSIRECISTSDVVIVAIHREYFRSTLQDVAHLLADKVVVDVSNRETLKVAQSNAEYLASILPGASVVKAFNSVSAFAMDDISESGTSPAVYVAGNDPEAREKVIILAQAMGFRAVNLGLLKASRWMEDDLLSVFPLWKMPIALATAIFVLAWVFVVYIYFINRDKPPYSWEQLFMKVLNKPVCMTAIAMMALTYLPGQLASVLQIYYGTKHRRFPQFMDFWLKCRKQMGLVSFFLVIIHAVLSVMMISPTYYGSWFHKATVTVPANSTLNSALVLTVSKHWMTWKGESACLLGTLAFVLMGVVAVTSIRSVGDSLNWSEWRSVQSNLGYIVLAVSAAHATVMGAQGWYKRGFPKVFFAVTFLSVLLPFLVLAMKLAFSLPPLSGYLRKIRRGWEREGARYGDLEGGGNGQQAYCNLPGSSGGARQGNGDCCGDNIELEKSGSGAAFGGNKNAQVTF